MFEGLFQPMHLLLIAVIAFVVIGPKKLPELGAGIGKALREFKNTMSDIEKPLIKSETSGKEKTDQPASESKQA